MERITVATWSERALGSLVRIPTGPFAGHLKEDRHFEGTDIL
jgi:hypothetical protein